MRSSGDRFPQIWLCSALVVVAGMVAVAAAAAVVDDAAGGWGASNVDVAGVMFGIGLAAVTLVSSCRCACVAVVP